jgi:integrase/recombinase XerD
MAVYKKQTTRPNGTKDTSKRFYGTMRCANGKRKLIALTEDRKTSEMLLSRLQTVEYDNLALGITESTLERLRPIDDVLDEYAAYLRSKANTELYVASTVNRILKLFNMTKSKTLADLDTSRLGNALSNLRKDGASIATSNHYARAIKGFSRWAWTERKTVEDPLRSLRYLINTDIKRKRRAFTQDELRRLITTTESSGVTLWGLTPKQRSMLYLVAAFTGLRAHELSSLTRQSFDLARKTVTVQAGYSKRRREDVLPLNASLLMKLEPWIVNLDGLLWDGTWSSASSSHVMRMMRIDLKRAEIEYLVAGRYADFHALRHTFISSLARSGVHPSKAKELARHSTITLTMDVYSHVETEALRSAVDMLTY